MTLCRNSFSSHFGWIFSNCATSAPIGIASPAAQAMAMTMIQSIFKLRSSYTERDKTLQLEVYVRVISLDRGSEQNEKARARARAWKVKIGD